MKDLFPCAHLGEKCFGIKRVLNCVVHVTFRYPSGAIGFKFCMQFRCWLPDGDQQQPGDVMLYVAAILILEKDAKDLR